MKKYNNNNMFIHHEGSKYEYMTKSRQTIRHRLQSIKWYKIGLFR